MEVDPDGAGEGLRAVSDSLVSLIAHEVRAEKESRVLGSGGRSDVRNSEEDDDKDGSLMAGSRCDDITNIGDSEDWVRSG